MYNGIGLQTPRGSGTNGYIQTNKFFVKPKTGKVAHTTRGFEADQGTGGITKKPNRDILEHDRKRQIEVKLLELEDKLIEQGYTDAEVAEKLDEARQVLEAAAASETSGGPSALLAVEAKVSDTQSHQIAARKEKQMEALRAALGIQEADPHEQNEEVTDDVPRSDQKNENNGSKWSEKREHAFLDRDFSSKKRVMDDETDNEKHALISKLKEERDEPKSHKKEKKRRKHHDDSSDSEDSGKAVKGARKKHHKAKRSDSETETDSDDSEDYRYSKKHKKSRKYHSDGLSSDDFYDEKKKSRNSGRKKNSRRPDSGSDYSVSSDDDDSSIDKRSKRSLDKHKKSRRHDSDSDYSSTDDDDDSRKHSSKKKVEKFNKSSKRHHCDDTDSDSDDSARHERNVGKGHSRKEVEDSRWGQESDTSLPKHCEKNRRHDSEDESDGDNEVKKREIVVRSEVSKQGGSQRSAIDDYVGGDKRKTDDIHGQRFKRLGDCESDSDEGRRHRKDGRYNRNESDSDDGSHGKIDKREDGEYIKSRNQDVHRERKDDKYDQPSSRYDARRYEDKSDRRRDDSSRYIRSQGEDKYAERERGWRGRTEEDGQGGSHSKRARYDRYDDHRSSERKRYRD